MVLRPNQGFIEGLVTIYHNSVIQFTIIQIYCFQLLYCQFSNKHGLSFTFQNITFAFVGFHLKNHWENLIESFSHICIIYNDVRRTFIGVTK